MSIERLNAIHQALTESAIQIGTDPENAVADFEAFIPHGHVGERVEESDGGEEDTDSDLEGYGGNELERSARQSIVRWYVILLCTWLDSTDRSCSA